MGEVVGNKPNVWFWAISSFALLWNLFGGYDFYNSISLNEAYLAAYPGYLDFMQTMPIWAKAAWGISIVGSILGSICLLLRKALAYPLYIIAVLGMFVAFGYQFTAQNKPEMATIMIVMTAVIWAFAFFLIWFSKRAKAKNWLK